MLIFDVESSHLRQIGYAEKDKLLFINFWNGDRYYYIGVPQYVFKELLSAPSCGKYFWKRIRGTFAYYRE